MVGDRAKLARRLLGDPVAHLDARRGVDVRIRTPGDNTDRRSAYFVARAHYEELLRGGVMLYHYAPTMIHAKTFVVESLFLTDLEHATVVALGASEPSGPWARLVEHAAQLVAPLL